MGCDFDVDQSFTKMILYVMKICLRKTKKHQLRNAFTKKNSIEMNLSSEHP